MHFIKQLSVFCNYLKIQKNKKGETESEEDVDMEIDVLVSNCSVF